MQSSGANPENIATEYILLKTRVLGYIYFSRRQYGSIFRQFGVVGSETYRFRRETAEEL